MTETTQATSRGMWLGLLGVAIFAVTLPMTRIATGTAQTPHMSALFIAMGRAAVAGILSILLLRWTRAAMPARADWPSLALTAAGVVFGFPLLTSWAMRYVEAVHASVILGVLPLATAIVGVVLQKQRPSWRFWFYATLGCAVVVGYALISSGHPLLAMRFETADLALFAAMACAAVGYGHGAKLSRHMRAEHVICWALVMSLPITLPMALWSQPQAVLPAACWWAFAYVAVFSMWVGFFAWYRGLALGGTVRVSQVQLIQPFLGMLFSVPLLGEALDATSLAFGLGIIAIVFMGKKSPVHPPLRR